MNRHTFLKTLISITMCVTATVTHSQLALSNSNSVTMTIPLGPGGQLTNTATTLQPFLSKWIDQTVVIDFKPGGNGLIGAREVSKSNDPSHFLLGMVQYLDFDLNQTTEIVPVVEIGTVTLLMITGKQNITSFKSILEKPTKTQYTYGIVNGNSISKYVRGLVRAIAATNSNISFVEVPYKTASQLVMDTVGGHIDFSITALSAFKSMDSNKITPLLALGNSKLEALPAVPTPQDLKIRFPEEDSIFRMFLWASPKTSPDTIDKIRKNYLGFLRSPEGIDFFKQLNFNPPSEATAIKPAVTINQTLANDRK